MAKQRVFWVAVDPDREAVLVFKKKPHVARGSWENTCTWWGPESERFPVLNLCGKEWFRLTGIKIRAGERKKVSVVEVCGENS